MYTEEETQYGLNGQRPINNKKCVMHFCYHNRICSTSLHQKKQYEQDTKKSERSLKLLLQHI